MYCPNCGRERIGPEKRCSSCGYIFNKKPLSQQWWFWVIFAFLCIPWALFLMLLPFMQVAEEAANNQPAAAVAVTEAIAETAPETTAATDPGPVVYGEGMYRVGIDIPAGEYKIISTEAIMAYYEVTSDSTGSVKSRVTNSSFSTFEYVTVTEGQYLMVERAEFYLVG